MQEDAVSIIVTQNLDVYLSLQFFQYIEEVTYGLVPQALYL